MAVSVFCVSCELETPNLAVFFQYVHLPTSYDYKSVVSEDDLHGIPSWLFSQNHENPYLKKMFSILAKLILISNCIEHFFMRKSFMQEMPRSQITDLRSWVWVLDPDSSI